MRIKFLIREFPVLLSILVVSIIFAVITAVVGEYKLAIAEGAATVAFTLICIAYYSMLRRGKQKLIQKVSDSFTFSDGKYPEDFPIPLIIIDENGRIQWHNRLLEECLSGYNDYAEFQQMTEQECETLKNTGVGISIKFADKYFTAYSQLAKNGKYIVYFVDNTKLRIVADEFMRTRPAFLLISIDGMEEVERTYRDSDTSAVRNGVERIIDSWLSSYDCLKIKRSENTYIVFTQSGDIEKMCEQRFSVLDEVREYTYNGDSVNITLSIGAGAGSSVAESESQAKQSLEMAFGRGGDQAAVKINDSYEFFGGVSKSVERQDKVKTRIISDAFCELISGCERVLVMGHRYPDLDALGSCMGVAAIARAYGKEAYIVTDSASAPSKPLIDYITLNGFEDYIVDEAKAIGMIKKKTLLVITDTHIKSFVEFPSLLEKAGSVVVIDHHRKSVDFIDDAVIFYHDPSASSACELVTRMIQYLPNKIRIGSVIADSLLSGIMLDTKNFILRSGVNTFECAAYLKGAGADTVRVKKLFADSMDDYKLKSDIIASAQKYKNCAIAVCSEPNNDIRIIAAQAADELLNIKGVDASFVAFKTGESINVSARSFGELNVQLIMESLGGGGHQTMAAAQFTGEEFESIMNKLMSAIDNQLNK